MSHPGEPPTTTPHRAATPPTGPPEQPLVPPSPPTTVGWPPHVPPSGAAAAHPTATWGGAPPQPYGGWPPPAPPPGDGTAEALRTARTALGWAVGAAVGAGVALLGVFVVALLMAGSSSEGGLAEDDVLYETMRGEVVGLPAGSPLSGDRLERPLVDLIRGFEVEDVEISCPDTAAVSVSTVVVCTGDIDGYDWTGVVVFEDSIGSFAVAEL